MPDAAEWRQDNSDRAVLTTTQREIAYMWVLRQMVSKRSFSRVSVAVSLGFAVMVSGCGDEGSGGANANASALRIRARLDVPIQSGELRLVDHSGDTVFEEAVQLHNGTAQVELSPHARDMIESGDWMRVVLETSRGGVPITLASDIENFDLDRQVVGLSSVTSISAAYHDLHPAMAPEEARDVVWSFLGGRVDAANVCDALQAASGVDDLLAVSAQGTFDERVRALAAEIDHGAPFALQGPAATGTAGKLFQYGFELIATGIASGFTSKVLGFVMSSFAGPDRTQQSLEAIQAHLDENSKQLAAISAQVDALSAQLADVKDQITDVVNLRAYEQRASLLQKEINTLCSLQARLTWLALSDPKEEQKSYVENLRGDIELLVDPITRDLESELLGGMSFTGLISFWADLNSRGTGYPKFFSNAYLKKAVPHADFFIGAQTMALHLMVEQAHYVGGSLGKTIATSALNRLSAAVDMERRAVGANRGMNIASSTAYLAEILPSDNMVVPIPNYAETARVFTRSLVCVPGDGLYPGDTSRCTVHVLGPTSPSPTITDFLTTFEVDGVGGWQLPTVDHYNKLLAGRPVDEDLRAYLREGGFDVPFEGGEFLPYFVRNAGTLGNLAVYPPDGQVYEPRDTNNGYHDIGRALAVRNMLPEWAYVPPDPR